MKAQILKIAGVKNEKEFYKKYPTEEAFMKKHGKELKKAQYGTYVAGQPEQDEQKPIMYDDLYQDTMSRITGVSKEEKARQAFLNSQQDIAAGKSSSQGQGFGDILKGIDPEMIASAIGSIGGGGAKNGKKLPKAEGGIGVMGKPFQGIPKTPNSFSVSSNSGFNTDVSQNPYLSGSMIGGQQAQSSSGSWAANPYINSPFKASQTVPADSGSGFDWKGLAGKIAPQIGNIVGSFQQMDQNTKDIAKTNQWADIAQISGQAALSKTEKSKRRYVRPEDNLVMGANPLGKRDSLLAAENGAEIQNTYNPGDLYSDLAYEPLNDSNPKQYRRGGKMRKAEGGINLDPLAGIAGGIGGALGSATGKGTGKGGAGSQLGSAIGGIAGSFIPIPGVGTALGSLAGGFIGGLFDSQDQNKLQEAQDRQTAAINKATIGAGAASIQKANSSFMENGGYMNPEYNPQVIAKFGDYDVDQLFAPPHDADMLRAGGHLKEYTPPSAEAMYTGRDLPYQMENGGQMAMGGDLQVHRGEAETLSYNPFLPDGGETIMFRGPSHDNGGMPVSFGENGVEVEGGEPAVKLQDGGEEGNLVVYGNMIIPDYGAVEIGDEKAKGKKFKHYVADLSKLEAKQNKLIDKTTQLINNADANDSFDKLSLNTGEANMIGTTMKLKDIANKKMNAAAVQNAILDTASEHGLESDALAKGKIKYAKANDPYAEFGANLEQFGKGGKKGKKSTLTTAPSKDISTLPTFVKNIPYKERAKMAQAMGIPDYKGTAEQNDFLFKKQNVSESSPIGKSIQSAIIPTKDYKKMGVDAINKSIASGAYKTGTEPALEKKNNEDWWNTGLNAVSSVLPFVRPSNQSPLDSSQLAGEYYALSQNAEEPVFAQSYNPLLTQATSVSLQDQLNEITSQSRAAERMAQGNPAALAMIASQAQEAKNKVLGEQFRMNQSESQRVMEANRQAMNEANRFNIGLYDQQQQRQAQAKSATKQQNIAALNSISDKIAKNKLENKQMAIAENLYNYRFTPNGVAYNVNSPYSWNMGGAEAGKGKGTLAPGYAYTYDENRNIIGTRKTSTKNDDAEPSRNGSIVKAIKNL
jgi:type II secretory pathway pseudopilin PulG